MTDDVLLNKAAMVERCINRITEEYNACPALNHFTHQDALLLNLQRACQACIDMAMHAIARDHLGIPQSSADAFEMLAERTGLDATLANRLRKMTGFRNIAIHAYKDIDLAVLRGIITERLPDLVGFCRFFGVTIRPRLPS